jgi:hypothetical protein
VDYSLGYTGAAHDALAFQHTAAFRHPNYLFQGDEFAWADSAYPLSECVIPVHKKPASNIRQNAIFDRAVSHIRVRSEHCMGALKGRFQCLRGLRVTVNNDTDHVDALRWITCAIILHNMVIDVDGVAGAQQFQRAHTGDDEAVDRHGWGTPTEGEGSEDVNNPGEVKRQKLTNELLAYRELSGRSI